MTFDNTNRGTLSKSRERKTDKSPEYSGSINVNGTEYWLNGWVKDGKNGKFFSLAIKPKEQKQSQVPDKQTIDKAYAKVTAVFDDSEIPF